MGRMVKNREGSIVGMMEPASLIGRRLVKKRAAEELDRYEKWGWGTAGEGKWERNPSLTSEGRMIAGRRKGER